MNLQNSTFTILSLRQIITELLYPLINKWVYIKREQFLSFIRWDLAVKPCDVYGKYEHYCKNWVFKSTRTSFLIYQIQYFLSFLSSQVFNKKCSKNSLDRKYFRNSVKRTPANVCFMNVHKNNIPLWYLINAIIHFAKLRTVNWYISFVLILDTTTIHFISL